MVALTQACFTTRPTCISVAWKAKATPTVFDAPELEPPFSLFPTATLISLSAGRRRERRGATPAAFFPVPLLLLPPPDAPAADRLVPGAIAACDELRAAAFCVCYMKECVACFFHQPPL